MSENMSRDEIRAAIKKTNTIVIDGPVATPEWPAVDGKVYVRTMSGLDREAYIESIRRVIGEGKKQKVEIILQGSSAKLVAKTACDKDGNLLFDEEDVAWLALQSSTALERVTAAGSKLNGLGDDAEDAAKNASAETTVSASSSV